MAIFYLYRKASDAFGFHIIVYVLIVMPLYFLMSARRFLGREVL